MIAVVESNGTDATDTKTQLAALVEEVSASRLSMWLSCRLKFYFKYVLLLPQKVTPALHTGKVIHSCLEAWNMARWKGVVMDQATVREKFIQSWDEEQLDQGIDFEGEEQQQKDAALALVEMYMRETNIPPEEKPQAVEIWLEKEMTQYGLPKLVGIIDLVRGGQASGKIVDFKSAAQNLEKQRVIHNTEVQLSFYSQLYRDATGQKEAGFEIHTLLKQKQQRLIVTELPPINQQQESRLLKQIESYVEGVSREDWVPSPSQMACATCPYFSACRKWS